MAVTEKVGNVKAKVQYRRLDGSTVPGVTTVLGILNKPALVPWANDLGLQGIDVRLYVDKMANIGTLAHYLIECDLKEETPVLDIYAPEEINLAENCLLSYYEWKKKHNPKVIASELRLVSEQHGFGGTVDLYCEIDGERWLVDFKTGRAIYPEMITQLAAYARLLVEHNKLVDKTQILRIGRDETEGYEEQVKTKDELHPHWLKFKHCLAIYELDKLIRKAG